MNATPDSTSPATHATRFALAIETSTRRGEVALCRVGDRYELLGNIASLELSGGRRHNVELLPAIDTLCRDHGATPADLAVIAVSLGPGSFTGLRSGITVAKVLGFTRPQTTRLVGVPTMDVMASQAASSGMDRFVVRLNHKRGEAYAGGFDGDSKDWLPRGLYQEAELDTHGTPSVTGQTHPPRATTVLQLGLEYARQNAFTDPHELIPLYIRIPEAVEQWEKRKSSRVQE